MKWPKLRFFRKILFFLLSITIALLLIASSVKIFTVSHVEIAGTKNISGTEYAYSKIIFFLPVKKIEQQLYEANPDIQSVKIIKRYPNTVKINVVKGPPIAILAVQEGYYYLSVAGRIVAKRRQIDESKPLIATFEKINFASLSVGDIVSTKEVAYSLYFIEKLTEIGIIVDRVDISGFDVLVCKSGERTYSLTTSKDKEIQYSQLKTIIRQFRIEGKDYLSLDVRFNKPVVRLK